MAALNAGRERLTRCRAVWRLAPGVRPLFEELARTTEPRSA